MKGKPVLSVRDLAMYSARKCRYRMLNGYDIDEDIALAGKENQEKQSQSEYVEMNVYAPLKNEKNEIIGWIYGAVDEMIESNNSIVFVEHKACRKEPNDWFINASLIQLAMYMTLGKKMQVFKTAMFHANAGNAIKYLKRSERKIEGRLKMHPYRNFKIDFINTTELGRLLTLKAYEVIESYERATVYDSQMDQREQLFMMETIRYSERVKA